VADLAEAIAEGRSPRASATLALHVLDAMCALEEGGRERDVGLWPTHS